MKNTNEIEQRLISACMAGGPVCVAGAVGLGVSPECFANGQSATLWSGLVQAATEDKKTGAFFVARRAFGAAIPEDGMAAVQSIAKLEPTSIYAKELAEELVAEGKRRVIIIKLQAAMNAVTQDNKWDEAWAKAANWMREAQQAASKHALTADLEALCDAYIAEESAGKQPGIVGMGIPDFDEFFGMLAPGEVMVMAGRPGVGKTALALQMADNLVRHGKSAMIVSLEMNGKDLIGRLAKQRAGRASSIMRGCSKEDYEAAKQSRIKAAQLIKNDKGRLHIFEVQEASSISRIEDRVAMLASADSLPDCLVIDYLQLVQPEDSKMMREQQVAAISRRVKLMALAYRIPVVLLSQLNRDAEKNDRRPRLSDLRESGSIEQDADRVWLIYPDPEVVSVADSPSVGVIIEQAKNRNGQGGVAKPATFYKPAFIFEKP